MTAAILNETPDPADLQLSGRRLCAKDAADIHRISAAVYAGIDTSWTEKL